MTFRQVMTVYCDQDTNLNTITRNVHVVVTNNSSTHSGLTRRRKYNEIHWLEWAGIATRYRADGPGIESRERRIFHNRPDRPWGQPSLLYNGHRVSLPGVKRPGRGVNHPPPSSAEVKERVELYLYSPTGPWWHLPRRNLPFTFFLPIPRGLPSIHIVRITESLLYIILLPRGWSQ